MRYLVLVVVFAATFTFGVPAYANQPTQKCKNSDHLELVAGAVNKPLTAARVAVVHVDTMACRNQPGYAGDGWVITINGKPGMQLYSDAARWLGGQLAATSGAVTLEHKVTGSFQPYKSFDDGARAKLAAELAGA